MTIIYGQVEAVTVPASTRILENTTDIRITESGDTRITDEATSNLITSTLSANGTRIAFASTPYAKDGGAWENILNIYVKVNGVWVEPERVYKKISGAWKRGLQNMANVKISGLTAASSVAGTNEFEINESGTSKKVTGSQIFTYVFSPNEIVMAGTGALTLTTGTTAERPGTPTAGMIRYNSSTGGFEGYTTAWGSIGGGASAGGAIYENTQSITSSYTLTTNTNGFSVGPITISAGAAVTVPSGQRWVVL